VAGQRLGVQPVVPQRAHGDAGQVAPQHRQRARVERQAVPRVAGRVEAQAQGPPGRREGPLDGEGGGQVGVGRIGVERHVRLAGGRGQPGGQRGAAVVAVERHAGQQRQVERQPHVAPGRLQEVGRGGGRLGPEPPVAQRAATSTSRARPGRCQPAP
jgi:hypothetical protein